MILGYIVIKYFDKSMGIPYPQCGFTKRHGVWICYIVPCQKVFHELPFETLEMYIAVKKVINDIMLKRESHATSVG